MSYNGYNGYNSYSNNGGGNGGYSADPFHDRNAAGYNAGTVEMSSFNQQASPQSILDQCTDIGNGVTDVKNKLNRLGLLQKRSLGESDTSTNSATKQELSALTQEIMDQYRALTDRVRAVKSDPESQNPRYARQVALVETRLREAIQSYQRQEADFGREMRDRVERQFRIVRPDATEEEVRQAVENNDQVFSQALMRNNRQAQANEVLGAVRQRHQEMLEIERRLEVLMNLLQDMQVLLAKQEVTVMAIDQQAEQAAGDMSKANEELEVAVKTARSTRKKKWICLGICVAIVVIIVVAVVAYIMVNRAANGGGGGGGGGNQKRGVLFQRDLLADVQMNTARTVEFAGEQPVSRSPGADFVPPTPASRRRIPKIRGATIDRRFIVDWDDGVDAAGAGQ